MEDKIGQLHEDVIGVICSYLTLKEARRTSVLSRKWENMWTLTTRLCFDDSKRIDQFRHSWHSIQTRQHEGYKGATESEQSEFIRWVNEYVDNHRGTYLDEFVVVFHLDARHSLHLDKWISFAVKKRAKAIKIDLRRCLIGGNEEGEGNARYNFMKNVAVLPGIECLSTLELKYVNITGEMIEHLLSASPLLESLSLDSVGSLEAPLNLRIAGPSLKLTHLSISRPHGFASIEIRAPKLVSFSYFVHGATGATIVHLAEGLCCLRDLRVGSRSLNAEFFRYFPQLQTLKLMMFTDYGVLAPLALAPQIQLINLKHLTVTIFYPLQCDMSGLTNLINYCPLLRKFTLDMLHQLSVEPAVVALPWGNLHPHEYLKEVKIIGFIGHKRQIEITKYFVESLSSLEKLIIDTHCTCLVHEGKLKIREVAPWSKEKAEELRSEIRSGVELLIL